MMNIAIMCEFSGRVREAFWARGHNAWSIDIEPSEIPGQHIQGDCLLYLDGAWEFDCGILEPLSDDPRLHCCEGKHCFFRKIKWDMIIAFPPCTYLSSVGNRWMKNNPQREQKREEAFEFFMKIIDAPVPKICVENPLGYINSHYRKPDQIVHPYHFGDPELKRTCFWLKGLPTLAPLALYRKPKPLGYYGPQSKRPGKAIYFTDMISGSKKSGKIRSRTFPGIARAMAEQWG